MKGPLALEGSQQPKLTVHVATSARSCQTFKTPKQQSKRNTNLLNESALRASQPLINQGNIFDLI